MSEDIKENQLKKYEGKPIKLSKETFASILDLATSTQVRLFTKYTKDDIASFLLNPSRFTVQLFSVSDYFYNNNGIYKNIINSMANLPTLDYIIIPTQKTLAKVTDKSYGDYYGKVNAFADSINIKQTTRRMIKSIGRYGVYMGYVRTNGSDFYIQTLPLDWIRIKYKIGNDYQLEFNFRYFDKFFTQESIDLAWSIYPPEFKKLYNKYKTDTKSMYPWWQMLDIKSSVCIMYDDDDPYFMPMYSGMFQSLLNNEDYEELIKLGQTLDIVKLIIQKIPSDENGNLLVDNDFAKVMHQALMQVLPEGSSGFTTPFDINVESLANTNQEKEKLLEKAERGVFVRSGMSSALFADNGSHSGININIENVTSQIYTLLEKIEDMYTRKFLNIANSKNYQFKLKFFRTTNINIDETFNRNMELLGVGASIMPLFSLAGFDVESYTTMLQVEQLMGIKDMLVPVQSMHTASGKDGSSGRPKVKDNNISNDNTDASKNLDTNNPINK